MDVAKEPIGQNQVLAKRLFIGLFAYFSIHVLIRVLVSDSLELDEAEQVLLSQWLLPGYASQPPLYTWLQILFFKIFGLNVVALSLLKNGLLFLTFCFVYLSAKQLLKDTRLAILATLSLLLIPEISWESHRDLTHSVLVVTMSAASLYVTVRLLETRASLYYWLLGLIAGLGVLAKYNYVAFVLTLLFAVLTTPAGRAAMFDRRICISLTLMLLTDLPHLVWVASNSDVVTSAMDPLKIAKEPHLLKVIGDLSLRVIKFLTPLWMVYLILFPAGFAPAHRNRPPRPVILPLQRYLMIFFGMMLAMVVFLKATSFKERWMLPVLFVFPIYFSARLNPQGPGNAAFRRFVKTALATAVIVLLLISMRVVGASIINYYPKFNYPFGTIAKEIRSAGFTNGLIVGDRNFIAGNLRKQFPDSIAVAPTFKAIDMTGFADDRPILVLWNAEQSHALPEPLRDFVENGLGVETKKLPILYREVLYKYSHTHYASIGMMISH